MTAKIPSINGSPKLAITGCVIKMMPKMIVSSQNLHWSAYGKGNGLSEYSLGVGDPAAADQYQRFFDFLWDRSPSRVETAR